LRKDISIQVPFKEVIMFKFNNGLKLIAALLLSVIFGVAGCSTSQVVQPAQTTLSNNRLPIILDVVFEQPVPANTRIPITCNAKDDDGDALSFKWTASGGSLAGEGSNITFAAPGTPGSYMISVGVSDDKGGETSKSVTFDVIDTSNNKPVINSIIVEWPSPQKTTIDLVAEQKSSKETIIQTRSWGVVGIECLSYDPDGDPLTYTWISTGGKITGTNKLINWIAPGISGEYVVTVKVNDNEGGSTETSVKFNVKCCP
jgi:hypothetical protein